MTRLTFFKCGLILVALLFSFRGAAQSATFNNALPCDVELFIEEYATGCNPHFSQPVLIPAGSSVVVTFATGTVDVCISVNKIGSCPVNTGVHLNNGCHGGSLSDSGSVLASCCPGISATWNASWTPMTTFNIW